MKKIILFAFLLGNVALYGQSTVATINKGYKLNAGQYLDTRMGSILAGKSVPYSGVSAANAAIFPSFRCVGMTVLIDTLGSMKEYWYFGGTSNGNLVEKGTVGTYTAAFGMSLTGTAFRVDSSVIASRARLTNELAALPIDVVYKRSLSELMAIENPVATKLYSAVIDGVYANFTWDAASTEDDDTVMVVRSALEVGRFERVYENIIDVKWFIPAGTTDHWYAFDKAARFIVAQNKNLTLNIPAGDYEFSQPWFIRNFDGTTYQQVNMKVVGEANAFSGFGTRLHFNFKDKFGIGVQVGKSCSFENLQIVGDFAPPSSYDSTFYNTPFASWNDATCRDTRYSPFAGFVIDPFGNAGVPADGGYPGMSAFYTNNLDINGSTGTILNNCSITGFVVGFISSPNGQTFNAEMTHLETIAFKNVKTAIAVTQDQEKGCIAEDVQCWEVIHTVIDNANYGLSRSGNWYLKRFNIAGSVNTFINHPVKEFAPFFIQDLFAERLGTFGVYNGNNGANVHNADITFATPAERGNIAASHIEGSGITFYNSKISVSGSTVPVIIKGNVNFVKTMFEVTPFVNVLAASAAGVPFFENCNINYASNPVNQRLVSNTGNPNTMLPAVGRYTITNSQNIRFGIKEQWEVNNIRPTIETYTTNTSAVTITGSTYKFRVPQNQKYKFDSLDLVILNDGADNYFVGGIVTGINQITDTVTVSYCPNGVANGTYYLGGVHPLSFPCTFIGDYASGSPTVTNVVVDYGNVAALTGQWVRMPNGNLGGATDENIYSDYAKVLSTTPTTVTFSRNFTETVTGMSFTNNSVKTINLLSPFDDISNVTKQMPAGSTVTDMYGTKYEIIKGGYSATASDTRKAKYTVRSTAGFGIVDGTQGSGKVLTSDANGVGSWQTPSGGGGGMAYLTQSTAPTGSDTTKFWVNNSISNAGIWPIQEYYRTSWRTIRWYDSAANYTSRLKPLVVLATGQSNMDIRADARSPAPDSRVLYWNGTNWVVWNLGAFNNLGFQFAKNVAQVQDRVVRVIHSSLSGSSITNWNSPSGARFLDIRSKITASKTTMLDVILWRQGEAENADALLTYKAKFDTVINRFRNETWFNKINPVIVGGLIPTSYTGGSQKYFETINENEEQNLLYNSNAGLYSADATHFEGGAIDSSGSRMASVYLYGKTKVSPTLLVAPDATATWTKNSGLQVQGSGNVAIGNTVLNHASASGQNIGIGTFVSTMTGITNSVAIGHNANSGSANTSESISIGTSAGGLWPDAGNIAIGHNSGGTTSTKTVAVGWNAAQGNAGASAVHIGGEAGQIAAGNYQVNIGYRAGKQGSATGTGNIAIGWQTGFANSFNNVIQIGASVVADKANQVIIGASGTTEFRSANYRLNVGQTLPTAQGFNLALNTTTGQIELQNPTPYTAKTATYTILNTDNTVDATSGTFTATLPTAVGVSGKIYTIKNSGAGVITVATTSSQTIDGSTTYSLATQYKYVTVQSNGANWIVIANN